HPSPAREGPTSHKTNLRKITTRRLVRPVVRGNLLWCPVLPPSSADRPSTILKASFPGACDLGAAASRPGRAPRKKGGARGARNPSTLETGLGQITEMTQHDLLPPTDAKALPFRAPYAPPDEDIAAAFLQAAPFNAAAEARIDARAGALVKAIRAHAG